LLWILFKKLYSVQINIVKHQTIKLKTLLKTVMQSSWHLREYQFAMKQAFAQSQKRRTFYFPNVKTKITWRCKLGIYVIILWSKQGKWLLRNIETCTTVQLCYIVIYFYECNLNYANFVVFLIRCCILQVIRGNPVFTEFLRVIFFTKNRKMDIVFGSNFSEFFVRLLLTNEWASDGNISVQVHVLEGLRKT